MELVFFTTIIFILLCLAVYYLRKISKQTKPPEWRAEDHEVKDWRKEEEERQAEERKKRAERREFLKKVDRQVKREWEAKRRATKGKT